jgi:hypothetical protein
MKGHKVGGDAKKVQHKAHEKGSTGLSVKLSWDRELFLVPIHFWTASRDSI